MLGKGFTSLSTHGDSKFSRSKPSHCYLANGAIAPLSHAGQNVFHYRHSWTHQAATMKRIQTPAQGERGETAQLPLVLKRPRTRDRVYHNTCPHIEPREQRAR